MRRLKKSCSTILLSSRTSRSEFVERVALVRCLVTGSFSYDYNSRWETLRDAEPERLDCDPELAAAYRQGHSPRRATP